MYIQSILETVVLGYLATVVLIMTSATTCGQEFFNGRGIANPAGNDIRTYSDSITQQFNQPLNNPLAGIFKKPAFLEKLKMPTINLKKPNLDLFNLSGNNDQSAASGFLANLPKLKNLIPQRDTNQQSFLGKLKAKANTLFRPPLSSESSNLGQPSPSEHATVSWDEIRNTMESIIGDGETLAPLRPGGFAPPTQR